MPRDRAAPRRKTRCPSCGHAADGAGPLNFCPECGTDLRARGGGRGGPGTLLGQVVADRYRLLSVAGEGGMGSVFKAEHIRMGKVLALKILRGDFAREEGAVERFRAEAQIVSRLSHPHTIAVFDFGELDAGSGFYLAMEYVPGQDLAAALRDAGRLPEGRAARIGEQVLGSLAEAHDAGIVHRDVKPGNVMLMATRSGEDFAKVLDFGIAKLRDDGGAGATTTSAGAIVGTPSYLAPEQARGGALDGRTDLYAVGCLLYELVAGQPPFQAPSSMAVVSAHLHQPAPPLAERAPGVSRGFAAVVHRALAKAPEDRFASADEMRAALLAPGRADGAARSARRPASPRVTGELEIASRQDFREFDRQVRALRRGRRVAPLCLLLLAGAAGAAAWSWPLVYAAVARRAPAVAAALPESLRPSGFFDGEEHEPNDVPARANPLPLPPDAEGRPAAGPALVRGHVGARRSETTGDVDLYRLELPPAPGRRALVAEWRGEREGEGIRGLDVALALNREPTGAEGRASAPLVAAADRGGPGRPERLVAAVEAGVYYVAVRERHDEASGPVEKPTDRYQLSVRLAEPDPRVELEPNDAPEPAGGERGYGAWRAIGERNPAAAGTSVAGELGDGDRDVFALSGAGAGALVLAVPSPELALAAALWAPAAEDLAGAAEGRARFAAADEGPPGAPVAVPLPSTSAAAPPLVELRPAAGEGSYDLAVLDEGVPSGGLVLEAVRALADAGRPAPALEVAAAYARLLPGAARRADVLLEAGRRAEALAGGLSLVSLPAHDRAARRLGAPLFEVVEGTVRYRGAFEAAAGGEGRAADEAALRLVALAAPCTPEDVAGRAAAFLERRPAPDPDLAAAAQVVRARALEDGLWRAAPRDAARLAAAVAAWEAVAAGGEAAADEARLRIAALSAPRPSSEGARAVCP